MPGAAMVTVQLGQCGNQLGHELFGALAREGGGVADEALPQFFRRGAAEGGAEGGGGSAAPVARSVLVDMEPKVIWQVVERASRSGGRWRYQVTLAHLGDTKALLRPGPPPVPPEGT